MQKIELTRYHMINLVSFFLLLSFYGIIIMHIECLCVCVCVCV